MVSAPSMIGLMVLATLACHIHAEDPGVPDIIEPFETMETINNFNVEEEYEPFSEKCHELVTVDTEKIGSTCSILPKQTGLWQMQGLSCNAYDESVLAFQLANLDMVGFVNKTGHWHSFEGSERLIPGSRGLGFRNDYDSLIGGHMELTKVSVASGSKLEATRLLYNHDPNTAVEEEIKLALAKLRIITSEALRFTRIKEQVSLGWNSEESFIRAEDAQYLPMWREISEALLSWKETGSWGGEHARSLSNVGIHDEEDALNLVRLVCAPPPETWKPRVQQ